MDTMCSTVSWLPDNSKDEVDFTESSFFKIANRKLPSPQSLNAPREGIITVSDMQLVVKFGPRVTVDEAVTMWAVRKFLGHQVPVPELFGWRIYRDTVFIYMELIPGPNLQECWSDMNVCDKGAICSQLQEILRSIRHLKHQDTFIGKKIYSLET